jgi:signal-transduction protein with cAMP-binding, CBS, and nucleotidyltransferase domain
MPHYVTQLGNSFVLLTQIFLVFENVVGDTKLLEHWQRNDIRILKRSLYNERKKK